MVLACNLYIDGEFDGVINSTKEISIGKNGNVKAKIKAHRLIVQGLIDGEIDADYVEIKADGKVTGSIESTELVIEAKGVFEGTSIVKKPQQQKQIPKKSGVKE